MTDHAAGDPHVDPKFPGRPQHPDFWRIAEVVSAADDQSDSGASLPEVMAGLVDADSLTYVARQRVLRGQMKVSAGHLDPTLTSLLMAVWVDAFVAGARFQQAGGHQDDPSVS